MVKLFFIVLLFVMCESVAMAAGTIVLASWYGVACLGRKPHGKWGAFQSQRDTNRLWRIKTLPIHRDWLLSIRIMVGD